MANNITSILHIIARVVGRRGYMNLYPLIFAGVDGRNAAYDPIVLRDVDIDKFLFSPARINERSIHRPFFLKCLRACNPSALYIEGLRLACQDGPIDSSIIMLEAAKPHLRYAVFVLSLIYICSGNQTAAERTMSPLCRSHPSKPLYTCGELAEAEQICNMIFMQINAMVPTESGRFIHTWSYRPVPKCVSRVCEEDCHCFLHCSHSCPCIKFFFYLYSIKLVELC